MQRLVLNLRDLVKPICQVLLVLLYLLQHTRINQPCLRRQVQFRLLQLAPCLLIIGVLNKRFDVDVPLLVLLFVVEVDVTSFEVALLAEAEEGRAALQVLLKYKDVNYLQPLGLLEQEGDQF